ncbi:unnamed protein product [Periconia digitata]|uniref:Uncharacterized protein n=1 Tax=Periconia digitata TaxID=1303443 RepID=A0A9W4U712_9PLEO|nr:unnamed protein product [Periconia digitata]
MPPFHSQHLSPLFLLPTELRHRIYEYYLAFTHSSFLADSLRPTVEYLDPSKPYTTALPSLPQTCKRAYTELAPMLASTAALRVYHPGARNGRRIGFAVHGRLRFERLRCLILIIDLEYAYWNEWLEFFGAVVARAEGLECVVVDWAPRRAAVRAGTWEVRRDAKKERIFLDLLKGLRGLRVVRFYGEMLGSWAEEVEGGMEGGGFVVRCEAGRWWNEPGFS